MNDWNAPQRPNAYAEQALTQAILEGTFEPGTTLPGERSLAVQLGVTRPTLREALQRLARDGWLTVRQGKATVVNDFWHDGGLNVLSALVRHPDHLSPGFVTHLLEVRLQLAPAYAKAAVQNNPEGVAALLDGHRHLADSAQAFAAFDWRLHRQLTILSENPIYTLILNGFTEIYEPLALLYFAPQSARERSRRFYAALQAAAETSDFAASESLSRQAMRDSIEIWHAAAAARR